METGSLILAGYNSFGRPRQAFADWIALANDAEFIRITEDRIWLSAYASNNPRSDYHWQAEACYDEAVRRGNIDLYYKAYERAKHS